MVNSEVVAVSAPGKVLLSGGYLVTDRDYTGLVFGLDARIHVVVKKSEAQPEDQTRTAAKPSFNVLVTSPQFTKTQWQYRCEQLEEDRGYRVTQVSEGSRNPFVESTLCYIFSSLSTKIRPEPLEIHVLADESYYSQAHTATACSTNTSSRFVNFNVPLSEAHKTGLGSSAALVTALTGALLQFLSPPDKADSDGATQWRSLTHNLAQAAHCSAQGKIGSGFDVAAAVWGSCVYRRFSPSILEEIGERNDPQFAVKLNQVVRDIDGRGAIRAPPRWNAEVRETAHMPRGLRIILCDIDQGTSTPGMVQKVMKWRKGNPEAADRIWTRLQDGTVQLEQVLRQMAMSEVRTEERDSQRLRQVIDEIRRGVRDMSAAADVPIEPAEQTALLDGIIRACPAVLGGVVPGAGGYDALALLMEDSDRAVQALEAYYADYMRQDPSRRGRLLRTREDMQGVKAERLDIYQGWV